jgi:hypothetical protein
VKWTRRIVGDLDGFIGVAGRRDDLHVARGSARGAGTSGISASFAPNRMPERRDDPNTSFNSR